MAYECQACFTRFIEQYAKRDAYNTRVCPSCGYEQLKLLPINWGQRGTNRMGTPEDIAADKYFTPPTLTAMLIKALHEDLESESESEAEGRKYYLDTIKSTFKEWLKTVGIPHQMSEDATRQLLITLVDEPE